MNNKFTKLTTLVAVIALMLLLFNACSQQNSSSQVVVPDIPQAQQPSPSINVNEAVNTIQQENRIVTTALGDNLLVNPAFEEGTLGWISCGGATDYSVTTDSVSGQAGKLSTGCFYQTVDATESTQLSLSCKTKITTATGWSGMGFGYIDSSFATLENAPVQTMSGSGFREYSTTLTAPANTAYASIWVYTDGTVHIDDCSLSSGAPSAPEGNLLSNPSFTSSADWFNCGDAANWNIASGNLNITDTACLYQTNNAQANLEYTLSCTSKRTGDVYTTFILNALDSSYASITKEVFAINSDSFQEQQVSLTTPADTTYIAATFYGEGATTHQECSLTAGGNTTPTQQAPSVTITSPSNGLTLANASNLIVDATASDADGTIANVKLYLNDQLVSQKNTAPYQWTGNTALQNLSEGSYTLRTEVTDNDGLTSSDSITIQVEAASIVSGSGLYGQYFNNINFTGTSFERIDSVINFNWGSGTAAPGIDQETYSIRWTGEIQPKYSDNYTFHATSDDGVRVWVNNQQIINDWRDRGAAESQGNISLTANQKYPIVVEYYDNTRFASMKLEWSSAQQAREVIPASQLFPSQTIESQAGSKGEWSGVQSWPLIATHLANLEDGRILAWSSYDEGRFGGVAGNKEYSQATIYDPATGNFEDVDNPTHDMFCAGLVTLSDGTVLAAGGGSTANQKKVSAFNFDTSTWNRLADMPNRHWYGTAVVDADDNVVVSLGKGSNNRTDYLSNDGTWKTLLDVSFAGTNDGDLESPDWYPALHLSPRGTIFHAGPTTEMHEFTTSGNGSTVSAGNRNQDGVNDEEYRQWGNAIMIDEGKIILTGGTPKENNPGSINTNVIVDINNTNPVVQKIAPMAYERTYHSTLLLPDGEILVLGGNGTGVEFSDTESHLTPEIYNPETDTWREVAAMSIPRNYHSAATLLQDGRILAAGGGLCGCDADHRDGQIYSPAYLFNEDGTPAPRPVISSAPDTIGYNQSFSVNVTGADANNITRFSMIRFSAVTHGVNTDLRQDVLDFNNQGNGTYSLTSHNNKNVVVPGYYFLFATNASGVPSVAKVIQIK